MLHHLDRYHIILASRSPRRKELLQGLGVKFTVKSLPDVDESYPDYLVGGEITRYIACKKAESYKPLLQDNDLLITADTLVYHNTQVLGKPGDGEEAKEMLRRLSGNTHEVFTGVCILTTNYETSFVARTKVRFATLAEDEISYYINQYQPFDKAGSYGVQEWIGYIGVEYISGSFYNVMGLPVQKLYTELKKLK
ncbi:MAG: septum formation protein Maf [Bacteroidales bacterium]|nr:septum formation protein Maf [Bacteroidales bacterium]